MSLDEVVAELVQGLEGEVTSLIPEQYQTDFGGLKKKQAKILVSARSEQDVVHTFKVAREASLPVTVRGAGHSCNGQSLNQGGIILENFIQDAQLEFLTDNLVTVTGRSRWREVEHLLNQNGLQTPILPNYLDLSVGGTLSVGGVGLNSIKHGFQVDNISRLRLIQPNGQVHWCSAEENSELFRFALAGLGQVGLIEKVVMKTEPFREFTHIFKRNHTSISQLLDFLPEVAGSNHEIEHFNGYICNGPMLPDSGRIVTEYGYFSDKSTINASDLVSPLFAKSDERITQQNFPFEIHSSRTAWLQMFPDYLRLWTDYIFDYEGIVRFMEFMESKMHHLPFSKALQIVYFLIMRRPTPHINFALLPAPSGKTLFGVGLYTAVHQSDRRLIAQTIETLKETLHMCYELGGRPYLFGCNEMDQKIKHQFYGTDYERLLELRNEFNLLMLNPESF